MIRPNGKRVLVTIADAPEVKLKGVIMPGVEKRITEAVIASVSDAVEDFNVGDVIMMDRYSGQEISYLDQKYLLVKLDDILCVVQNGQSPNEANAGSDL
jgi:chaperonin GroES